MSAAPMPYARWRALAAAEFERRHDRDARCVREGDWKAAFIRGEDIATAVDKVGALAHNRLDYAGRMGRRIPPPRGR